MHRGRRRPDVRTRTVVAVCLAAGVALAPAALAEPTDPPATAPAPSSGPTAAETPDSGPTPAWSADEDSPVGDPDDTPLSGQGLDEQVAEADRLAAELARGDTEISAAVKALKKYSTKANTLLQRKAKARDEYDKAKKEAADADKQLKNYQNRLSDGRRDLRSWAFDTYTRAGGYSDTMTLLDTLTHNTDSGSSSAGDLGYLTDERIRQVDLVRKGTVTKADLKRTKDKAKSTAAAAKKRADQAKKEADAVLKDRKERLETLREKHSKELEEAGPVINALLGQPDEAAQGASTRLKDALEELGQDVSEFEGAKPCSTNTETYGNGQIPPSALCPLLGAPGESLRPGAAAAFNTMSKAYQRDTGHTLCVTDSYRSYGEQVVTKANRGHFAAAPGTSNHGLGKALDLCGGVNNFGHPAHQWMQQNAPLYGWFHPSWAGAGGSLPEPWHWEYSG